MTSDTLDMQDALTLWMASEDKVAIAVFFRDNPGIIDTLENLAERLAIPRERLRRELGDHVRLGVIRERKLGSETVYVLDRRRRAQIEDYVTRIAGAR